jgi:hypothetical protein
LRANSAGCCTVCGFAQLLHHGIVVTNTNE